MRYRYASSGIVVAFLPFFFLLFQSCAGSPAPLRGEELLVMVYSADHEPVLGAEVRAAGGLLGRTDSFGRLVATGVEQGEQRFLCYAPGFAPKAFSFRFEGSTQILYITLQPLGTLLGRLLRQGESKALATLLRLLEEAQASREEQTLVRALLLATRGEAGWREEIGSISGELGAPRSETLARTLEELAE